MQTGGINDHSFNFIAEINLHYYEKPLIGTRGLGGSCMLLEKLVFILISSWNRRRMAWGWWIGI